MNNTAQGRDFAQKAIEAALNNDWQMAIEFNSAILSGTPMDIDALIRLARAYLEIGEPKKAKEYVQKAITLDPYNKIAVKINERVKNIKTSNTRSLDSKNGVSDKKQIFLEEAGKTKIVKLINLGDKRTIGQLSSGDHVELVCHQHRVSLNSVDGKYIGRLPDDLAAHLRRLIKFGNKYRAIIKNSTVDEVKIFIVEEFRSEKVKNVMSFPLEKINYVAFTPPELVHKNDIEIVDKEFEVDE